MDNDPEPVQEQKKEKPLNELLTSSIVDIYIGPDSTHWPLHERLLCYHSPFLANIFYKEWDKNNQDKNTNSSRKNKSYGFPEEEDYTFTLLVGWLYSRVVPPPKLEKEIGPLLDLYLLAQKLQIDKLSTDVVNAAREFYHETSSYPGLRRVQYIYANTDEDNEMREMIVSSVARQLATTEKIPMHWAKALQRNGQLAVDIIRAIQRWNIEERSIPDVRDISVGSGRGRLGKGGFSAVVREGDSLDTEATAVTDSISRGSNLGVESVKSEDLVSADDKTGHGMESLGRSFGEGGREIESQAKYITLSSLPSFQFRVLSSQPSLAAADTASSSSSPPSSPPPAYIEYNDRQQQQQQQQHTEPKTSIPSSVVVTSTSNNNHSRPKTPTSTSTSTSSTSTGTSSSFRRLRNRFARSPHQARKRTSRVQSSSLASVDEADELLTTEEDEENEEEEEQKEWPTWLEKGMQAVVGQQKETTLLVVLWALWVWWIVRTYYWVPTSSSASATGSTSGIVG